MKESVIVRKREEKRILQGHAWVFSNEIDRIEGEPAQGATVRVYRHDGVLLGTGLYHPHSLIAVRLLSRDEEEPDAEFFRKRLHTALSYRRSVYPDHQAFRLAHGESDGLPGLLIDVYGRTAVLQVFSAGMEFRIDLIVQALTDVLPLDVIVQRNDSPLRTLEGLDTESRILRGSPLPIDITEHGLAYRIDVTEGQKTGMFLDQKDNRLAIRRYLKDRPVLDCFTNLGGFALNASAAAAGAITVVDSSERAMQSVKDHFDINSLPAPEAITGDVFDVLSSFSAESRSFGGIILDPPAFTKNRRSLPQALKAYRKLNTAAIRLLDTDGILISASCSHHITRDAFLDILKQSGSRTGRKVQFIEVRGAAADHPVLSAMPETEYLKLAICRVL